KFRHFLPKRGRIWHKIDIFRDRFCENGPGPAAREPSQRAPSTNWGCQAESIITPRTDLPAGGHRISRAGRWLVTDMVKLRKLIGGIVANFPLAFCHFGVKPLLQTNGLSERVFVSGRFWGCKIVPNFDIF